MKNQFLILLCILVFCFWGCLNENKKCIPVKLDKEGFISLIKSDSLLKSQYFNMTISPSARGRHHIKVVVRDKQRQEEIRFINFFSKSIDPLQYSFAPYSGDNGIISDYVKLDLNSKEFLNYWHEKLSWLVKYNILSIHSEKWGFIFTTELTDTTYQDMTKKKFYFDSTYKQYAESLEKFGCKARYRYRFIVLTDNNYINEFKDFLNIINERKYVYKIDNNIYYCRTVSLSRFCSLDFEEACCLNGNNN